MPLPYLLIFPFIGASIGWFTNWLAVKMLFRPREPFSILGFRFHGLLPSRRADLARTIAETVQTELLSEEQIRAVILDLVHSEEMKQMLAKKVDELFDKQLHKLGPLQAPVAASGILEKLKPPIKDELFGFVRRMSRELHHDLAKQIDVRTIVRDKVESFDINKLENIIFRIASQELRHIEFLGAILGFIVGVLQSLTVWLAGGVSY